MKEAMTTYLLYLMSILASITPIKSDVLEACSWERLEAECPADHVILLDHARYGRLHLGKCVKQNFGYLGCFADVRSKIDPVCSGKQSCSLDVYQTLQNERPKACSELEAFLQIEYSCVPVVPLPRQHCIDRMLISVHESFGYLPSFHSNGDTLVAGRQGCTVELVAKRGQTWNLTLLDFGEPDDNTISDSAEITVKKESIWCTRYAVVKETVDSTEKSSVVCGNSETQTRERNFYLSNSNIVTIDMNLDVQSTYLIAFKVDGCAIPDTPNIIHVRKDGDTHMFHCNATGESWSLVCKGTHWQGHHKACGVVPKTSEFRTNARDWNSTTGLLIVVGLGLVLGVVIGSSLLGLVVCYYKRRYKRDPTIQQVYTGSTYGSSQQKDTSSLYKTYATEPGRRHQSNVEFGTKSAPSSDIYKYPYQSCRPNVPYIANIPDSAVSSAMPARALQYGTPARAALVGMDDDMTSTHASTGAGTQYGRTSDSSSSSDHVYEIPS